MKQLSSNITTWRLCALLSFGLFGSTVAWAENPVELRIEGVKNHALDENIRLHLNAVEKYDTTDIARYQDVVSAAIDKGLRALGYYDSTRRQSAFAYCARVAGRTGETCRNRGHDSR